MTKTESVVEIADATGMEPRQVKAFFEDLTKLAVSAMRKAKDQKDGLFLPGIGKLWVRNRKAGTMRNPMTGQPVKVSAKRVCKFTVAKPIKDAVASAKSK